MAERGESVRVVVRVRPLNPTEKAANRVPVVKADPKRGEIAIENPEGQQQQPHVFTFDSVYDVDCEQQAIYDITAAPIVESVLDGFNGTIFAYGQTGAGKSHTMEGNEALPGIIPNSFRHIFECIAARAAPGRQALVRASYLEIYNEEIRDLLSRDPTNKLELKEHPENGVYVKDLTSCVVKTPAEIESILTAGKKNRVTGATLMNAHSSRSHSLFTVTVETSETGPDGEAHIRVGKLNMMDLAGSERQSKTGATGNRLKEATKINLSLSALGNVISALVDAKATHVPYRDSKLTRLLQDSLGGNTKTVMIANCGPADYNYDETLSTLRYASRAKNIKNKPRINEDPKDAMLREFQEEIARLKARLAEEEAKAKQTTTAVVTIDGKQVTIPVNGDIDAARARGANEQELEALRAQAASDRADMVAKAELERNGILKQAKMSEEQRSQLEADLASRALEHERALKEKQQLAAEMEALQEKLLVGDQALNKAARQEEELRRAQFELDERRQQEANLARELEEANLVIEEQYASMAEELDAKTKKLKKFWNKLTRAQQEIQDLTEEFQTEREDLLDMVRALHRQVKLKQAVIDFFIPSSTADQIEARAIWDEDRDAWSIRQIELCGNRLRLRRPPSTLAPAIQLTVENVQLIPAARAQFTKQIRDNVPRYQAENSMELELEMPQRTTERY